MFRTLVRQFAREANIGEAAEAGPSTVIMKILRQHGPLNKNEIWEHAEAAGMKSKRHMKQTLLWLRECRQVFIECQRLPKPAQPAPPKPKRGKKGHAPPPDDRVFIYKLRAHTVPQEPLPDANEGAEAEARPG